MKIKIIDNAHHLRTPTKKLVRRLLSPLCGLNTNINFISHESTEPNILTAGAELTGVHIIQGLTTKHRPGSHHIGGSGSYHDEVLIKVVGETIERYSQMIAEKNDKYPIIFASYREMLKRNEAILSPEKLQFFSAEQTKQNEFPFQVFSETSPLSWIRAYSLISKQNIWVPAQLIYVGYKIRHQQGEPWLFSAVTTGTASHTNPTDALRNAILELTQIDTAMGHWYTETKAVAIEFDNRIKIFSDYIKSTLPATTPIPQFFWLKNADLGDFTIACVFESKSIPAVAVGLGSDTRLMHAMQKAYLEAIGVVALAKLVLINKSLSAELGNKPIFDLDTNVALYGKGMHNTIFKKKFNSSHTLPASQLPKDVARENLDDLKYLIDKYTSTGKELLFFNLTCSEAKELGFCVSRVWSPDTLSLCLPSAVQKAHTRFQAYGNVSHVTPHPYP